MRVTKRDIFGEIEELEYEKAFFGEQSGVALQRRGENDPHVCIVLLGEDDGNWFAKSFESSPLSSYWLPDLKKVLQEAEDWMERNCTKMQWGYKFK